MTLNDYQAAAKAFPKFEADEHPFYLGLALCGEAGEIANKLKKVWRADRQPTQRELMEIAHELGDVLYYVAMMADVMSVKLDTVAQMNLEKIRSRIARGTLEGDGDNR